MPPETSFLLISSSHLPCNNTGENSYRRKYKVAGEGISFRISPSSSVLISQQPKFNVSFANTDEFMIHDFQCGMQPRRLSPEQEVYNVRSMEVETELFIGPPESRIV